MSALTTDGLEPLDILMSRVLDETKRSMSATDMTRELSRRGWLPEFYTVIDIADEMKEWFGSNAKLTGGPSGPFG